MVKNVKKVLKKQLKNFFVGKCGVYQKKVVTLCPKLKEYSKLSTEYSKAI